MWGTNFQPNMKDTSKGVMNRLLIVPCNAGFDDTKPEGVALEAFEAGYESIADYVMDIEAEGVLAWAIEGLLRAQERKRFEIPEEMKHVAKEVYEDTNQVAGFIRECTTFEPNTMIKASDFLAAYRQWHAEMYEGHPPSQKRVGSDLGALGEGRIGLDRNELRNEDGRYYAGLIFNQRGKAYWLAHKRSLGTGDGLLSDVGVSTSVPIPRTWARKSSIVKLRAAHARSALREVSESPDSPDQSSEGMGQPERETKF
jgi:hypothetical protein